MIHGGAMAVTIRWIGRYKYVAVETYQPPHRQFIIEPDLPGTECLLQTQQRADSRLDTLAKRAGVFAQLRGAPVQIHSRWIEQENPNLGRCLSQSGCPARQGVA